MIKNEFIKHVIDELHRRGEKIEDREFIADQIPEEKWKVIRHVYQFHPGISDTRGKFQIAEIYVAGGFEAVQGMLPIARKEQELENTIQYARSKIHEANEKIEIAEKEIEVARKASQELAEQYSFIRNTNTPIPSKKSIF